MTALPETGFEEVRFLVLSDGREGVYTDWQQPRDIPVHRVYGSNISVVQDMGAHLAEWTATIQFESREDYFALLAKQGTVGTLTLYANYTRARGTIRYELSGTYEDLAETKLVRVDDTRFAEDGSWVEARATFSRPMNPLTGKVT